LLAPRDRSYTGLLTYSASENVQLVALHGPLPEGKVKGQTIWTPDGKTKFEQDGNMDVYWKCISSSFI
jgi:hypothetical protein